MYRVIDDRVLAWSTTHVGVEDAETASVSIGTGWFVPWLKEMKCDRCSPKKKKIGRNPEKQKY